MSPSASFRASEKHRNSTDYSSESKKQKTEEKEIATRYVSKGFLLDFSRLDSNLNNFGNCCKSVFLKIPKTGLFQQLNMN